MTTKDGSAEFEVKSIKDFAVDITSEDGLNPTGTVLAFAGNTVPNGYLQCNGAAVSRITYADLYAAIGTTYGAGNGSTTFNLPNLTDKFIEGSDAAGTAIEAGLPNITGSITNAYLGSSSTFSGAFSATVSSGHDYYGSSKNLWLITFDANSSNNIYGKSDTVQPSALTMKYIIKY